MVHTKQIQSSSLLAHISHMPRAEQQVDNSSSQQTVHPARYPTLTGDQVLGSRWSNSEGLDGEFGVSSQYSTYTMGDASTCTNNPCIITQQWSTTQQKTTFCRQLPTPTQAPQNPVYSLNASAVQTKEQYSACLLARHSLSSGQGDAHASQTVQGLARHSTAYPPATSLFASKHADDTAFLSDFVNFEECEASCSSESSSGKTVENSVHQPSHSVGAHNVRTSHYPPFVQSAQGSLLALHYLHPTSAPRLRHYKLRGQAYTSAYHNRNHCSLGKVPSQDLLQHQHQHQKQYQSQRQYQLQQQHQYHYQMQPCIQPAQQHFGMPYSSVLRVETENSEESDDDRSLCSEQHIRSTRASMEATFKLIANDWHQGYNHQYLGRKETKGRASETKGRAPETKGTKQKSSSPTHICGFCGKRFTRPFNLRSHILAHKNTRPFKCDELAETGGCEEKFTRLHDLRRHIAKKHPTAKLLEKGEKDAK